MEDCSDSGAAPPRASDEHIKSMVDVDVRGSSDNKVMQGGNRRQNRREMQQL